MKLLDKPMPTLTAEDLMSRDVIAVPLEMSLRGAALLLTRAHVSGAPVVDVNGRCVGVLSTSDFLKAAGKDDAAGSSCVCSEWQMMAAVEMPDDGVERYMTADPVTVPVDMLFPDVARLMLDAHIHRVIVVDDEGKPVGIVSSTDVLSAVAGPN